MAEIRPRGDGYKVPLYVSIVVKYEEALVSRGASFMLSAEYGAGFRLSLGATEYHSHHVT